MINFTRIKPDINGNGRLVCSWLSIPGATTYAESVKLAHKIGGRKYHNKSYGGGIVFQAYSEHELEKDILSLKRYLVKCDTCGYAMTQGDYRRGQGLCPTCIDAIN